MNRATGGRLRPEASVALHVQGLDGPALGPRHREPVSCGVPWPCGMLLDTRQLALVDGTDAPRPLQARALERWPDGSVRWTLLDWLASPGYEGSLRVGVSRTPVPAPASPLRVHRARGGLVVDTGRVRFRLGTGIAFPFEATLGDRSALDTAAGGLCVEDDRGRRYRPHIGAVNLEEAGPLRARVALSGRLDADGSSPLLALHARLHFFADSATVRFELTLLNPRRAGHPGGRWTLGRRGSVYVRDASLVVVLGEPGATRVLCSPEPGAPLSAHPAPLTLYQDSSGGEHWDSRNHINRHRQIPNRFRGYRLRAGEIERSGARATPVLALEGGGRHAALAMRHFWQTFPKAVEARAGTLVLRLFPDQYADVHEIQGGEQKTHVFHLALERDGVSEIPLEWCRSPLLAHVEPQWYARVQAVPYLLARDDDPRPDYAAFVDRAIDGAERFEHKREIIDEYGWRHFGDLYADHEGAYYAGPKPIVSHYNNQYDAIKGFAVHFMRSADVRWFRPMDELAAHVTDIDIYHTDKDKSAYNHGLFWHTDHYVSAETSAHRSYPALPGVAGGGPSPGHLYTTGLMLHHLLTGEPRSREAVLELGRYVIDADDGTRTIFRFIDRGFTGHVSESGHDGYHGPGRTPGNAINALLDAHRLSGERRYLDKAEQLVRRCIHPADDLDARALHDAENRWFYTVFLYSLERYLDHKIEHGELDEAYAYARASLLHYMRWALAHEQPYLQNAEGLEFPTETWTAQDMRKSDLFELAARHAPASERARYLERAGFFFDYVLKTLPRMPTCTFTRPLVLMLTHGYMHGHVQRHGVQAAPAPCATPRDLGKPRTFVPQKRRARRRLAYVAVLAGLAGLAAFIA